MPSKRELKAQLEQRLTENQFLIRIHSRLKATDIQEYQLARRVQALPDTWETDGDAILKDYKAIFADASGKFYDGEMQFYYERLLLFMDYKRSQPKQLTLFKEWI